MSNPMVLQLKDIVKSYPSCQKGESDSKEIRVLDNVSLELNAGEAVALVGPSGVGKSTLLHIAGLLDVPTSGEITLLGHSGTGLRDRVRTQLRRDHMGFVYQAHHLLPEFTALENVMFPQLVADKPRKKARERAEMLLSIVGLEERLHHRPSQLSGGEQQRVALARALVNDPTVLLADEPTGNLDSETGQEVMMILRDLARDHGYSILLVTHDPRVEEIADRILWLEDGKLHDRKSEQHSWAIDPVCGMKVDQWKATIFSNYNDKRYIFCSERCLQRFQDSPTSYVK